MVQNKEPEHFLRMFRGRFIILEVIFLTFLSYIGLESLRHCKGAEMELLTGPESFIGHFTCNALRYGISRRPFQKLM